MKNNKISLNNLLKQLRHLIVQARGKILCAVDAVQVRTYWEIGRHIIEFEQQGEVRAVYGTRLLAQLSENLTQEFGKGFDARNLRHMRGFYSMFPIWNAVRTELSWTHFRNLLRIENAGARQWYMNESISQNWSSRALERQINTLYYERLLASQDKKPVKEEAQKNIEKLKQSPREFIRDPILLEFLGFPGLELSLKKI